MEQSDFIKSKGNIRQFIITSNYTSALESLATENPADPYGEKLKYQFNERD